MTDAATTRPGGAAALGLALALGVTAALLVVFHDTFWWPPDEGVYAYIADRLNHGAVLHRDVQDMHAGYVHFVNAAALQLFGRDLLSLRYPLMAATVVQAALLYFVLLPRGVVAALAGTIALSSLSFIQFLNPSANWYALFFAVATIAAIALIPRGQRGRYIVIGAMIGLTFVFRQLSGALVAMGAVACLLLEAEDREGKRPAALLARSIALVMAAGLALFAAPRLDAFTLVVLALGPALVLLRLIVLARAPDRAVLRMVGGLAVGALLAALPLLVYLVANGVVVDWLDDSVGAAFHLSELEFMDKPRVYRLAVVGAGNLVDGATLAIRANGLFWLVLSVAPLALGAVAAWAAWRGRAHALVLVAVFHAIGTLYLQIPIYVLIASGLVVAGLVHALAGGGAVRRAAAVVLALGLSTVAVLWQAGEPLSRNIPGVLRGDHVPQRAAGLPGASLVMETPVQEIYDTLLRLIEHYARPDEPILALPMNPELYFLSGRNPPVDFYNSAIGLRDEADLEAARKVLAADPPRLVIHREADKYNTPLARALLDELVARGERVGRIGGFDVYLMPRR